MASVETCVTCPLRGLDLSPSQARAAGHIIIEGGHMAEDTRRQVNLKRIAGVVMDHFEAPEAVKAATLTCVEAHTSGSCTFGAESEEV